MGDKSYHPCSAEREPDHISWKKRLLLNMQQSFLANIKPTFLPREPVNTVWPLSVDIPQSLKHSDNLEQFPSTTLGRWVSVREKATEPGTKSKVGFQTPCSHHCAQKITISQLMPVCLVLPPVLPLGEACRLLGALPGCKVWEEGRGEELGWRAFRCVTRPAASVERWILWKAALVRCCLGLDQLLQRWSTAPGRRLQQKRRIWLPALTKAEEGSYEPFCLWGPVQNAPPSWSSSLQDFPKIFLARRGEAFFFYYY